jgi:BMFP domain-containing protein YqiC
MRAPETAMVDAQKIEDVAARLASVLPPGLFGLRRELEENFRAVLRANLERFDLVSRERFEIQATLLARTQERLLALEERLAKLEK